MSIYPTYPKLISTNPEALIMVVLLYKCKVLKTNAYLNDGHGVVPMIMPPC